MDLKPIETIYNGNRFRSRLEARWAVYFDLLNIKYQYEPEGFECDCFLYLPDFYIPAEDVYIEIKGCGALTIQNDFLADGREKAEKYNVCCDNIIQSGHGFLLLCGSPIEIIEEKEGTFAYCGNWDRFYGKNDKMLDVAYKAQRFKDDLLVDYSIVKEVRDVKKEEAQIASYLHFEHGESFDDYLEKVADCYYYYDTIENKGVYGNRRLQLRSVCGSIENDIKRHKIHDIKEIIGISCIHPEFLLDDSSADSIDYGLENIEASRWSHILYGLLHSKRANKSMDIEDIVRSLERGWITKFDSSLIYKAKKERENLSDNSFETFNVYIDDFSGRHLTNNRKFIEHLKSMDEIIKKRRGAFT